MISPADVDKEEARYQKLAEASTEDRTPIPSRARGHDMKIPLLQPLLLEETARSMAPCLKLSNARPPGEEVLAVVESQSPSDDAVYEALVGMELCARPTSKGEATTPTQDTGGLTPIIESDGLATPLSETVPAETDPIDILTASQNEVPLVRATPSGVLHHPAYTASHPDSSWDRPQPQALDTVRRNSTPVSAGSISRPSSPILSGSEGPSFSVKRGPPARRSRAALTRSSSRSGMSSTPSRQSTGDSNSKPDSAEVSSQCFPDTGTHPAHERPLVLSGPPPSSFAQRGRSPVPAFLGAHGVTTLHASSLPPSRSSSLTPDGAARSNLLPSVGLSRPVANASTIGHGQYGDPVRGLHLSTEPHPNTPGTHLTTPPTQGRFGPYHPNQSHSSIYRDLVTAVGLSPGTHFPYTLLNPAVVLMSDTSNDGTLDPEVELRQIPLSRGSALHDRDLRAMEEGVDSGHDKGASDTLCDPHPHDSHGATSGGGAAQRFPLKVFRRRDFKVLEIEKEWDDERLLTALKKTYDQLRGWRKYFGLMSVAYLTPVLALESFIYPQRVGTRWISSHKNMRMCYLLRNPAHQRGERQLMAALTQHVELGVEFVERWKTRRLLGVAGFCAFLSYATMIGWGVKSGDWATGSQIGQFHLAMFSLLFIAVAWSQNHEF